MKLEEFGHRLKTDLEPGLYDHLEDEAAARAYLQRYPQYSDLVDGFKPAQAPSSPVDPTQFRPHVYAAAAVLLALTTIVVLFGSEMELSNRFVDLWFRWMLFFTIVLVMAYFATSRQGEVHFFHNREREAEIADIEGSRAVAGIHRQTLRQTEGDLPPSVLTDLLARKQIIEMDLERLRQEKHIERHAEMQENLDVLALQLKDIEQQIKIEKLTMENRPKAKKAK
jgi:hypothetical protein